MLIVSSLLGVLVSFDGLHDDSRLRSKVKCGFTKVKGDFRELKCGFKIVVRGLDFVICKS